MEPAYPHPTQNIHIQIHSLVALLLNTVIHWTTDTSIPPTMMDPPTEGPHEVEDTSTTMTGSFLSSYDDSYASASLLEDTSVEEEESQIAQVRDAEGLLSVLEDFILKELDEYVSSDDEDDDDDESDSGQEDDDDASESSSFSDSSTSDEEEEGGDTKAIKDAFQARNRMRSLEYSVVGRLPKKKNKTKDSEKKKEHLLSKHSVRGKDH